MDINQLSEIVKKKILDSKLIEYLEIEDKSFLHKNHKSNNPNKFHLKLKIKSEKLNNMSRIESNKVIIKLLENELKNIFILYKYYFFNSEIRNCFKVF